MASLLPTAHAPLDAEVPVPGSKSETNRALVLAALSDGPSRIEGALASRDSALMVGALEALGARITVEGDVVHVDPPQSFSPAAAGIDCGLAGTVMRFVPPLSLLAGGTTAFHGDPHASQRPMKGLLDALRSLGAEVDADQLPFTVSGTSTGGAVTLDASGSSQFISGLLLSGARFRDGLTVEHRGPSVPSLPHIAMTVGMLRDRGVHVEETGPTSWHVEPSTIRAIDVRVEPDLTNAAAFLAAAMVAGGRVRVSGWPSSSIQPGAVFLDVARRMGAAVDVTDGVATVTGHGRPRAVDVDLHAASELTPVVAALAAIADGTTTISGVGHIRGHETDRLRALVTELTRLGVDARETDDGLQITGTNQTTAREPFETYADHRMVHTAALLALRTDGLRVTDLVCVSKTMPDFADRWKAMMNA